MSNKISPCPFCGSDSVDVKNVYNRNISIGNQKPPEVICATLTHHCRIPDGMDTYTTMAISLRGRDEDDVINKWNTRN